MMFVRGVSNHAIYGARQFSLLCFLLSVRLKILTYHFNHYQPCLVSAQVDVWHSFGNSGVSFEDNVRTLECEDNLILLCVGRYDVTSGCKHGNRQ